jgi:hypothetical protein
MTERKPPGVSWESFVERQIREAQERGDFDGLSGHGKPIADIDAPHDDLWWVKQKVRRENVSALPPTLALRKQVEEARALIDGARTEAAVREIVVEINTRIVDANRMATGGPPTTLMPLDIERTVEGWRAARIPAKGAAESS